MKRMILLPLLILMLLAPRGAWGATQIGVRGGYSHATGDVFEGSGDIGGGGLYGVIASIGLFAIIDLEFAYERYTTEFDLDEEAFEDVFVGEDATYEDQAYLFTGLLDLGPLLGPLSLHAGGGFSLHDIRLKDIEQIPDQIDPDRSDWEWHLVGGASLRIPGLPLRGYAEYRYQNVQGDDNPTYSSIYAGINLYLD